MNSLTPDSKKTHRLRKEVRPAVHSSQRLSAFLGRPSLLRGKFTEHLVRGVFSLPIERISSFSSCRLLGCPAATKATCLVSGRPPRISDYRRVLANYGLIRLFVHFSLVLALVVREAFGHPSCQAPRFLVGVVRSSYTWRSLIIPLSYFVYNRQLVRVLC